MAVAATLFHRVVEYYINLAVFFFAIALMAWALVHAALQRPDAFTAVGSLKKNGWLGVLGGLLVGGVLFYNLGLFIVLYIGIAAAAYYLLEVRNAIKDVSEGPW